MLKGSGELGLPICRMGAPTRQNNMLQGNIGEILPKSSHDQLMSLLSFWECKH